MKVNYCYECQLIVVHFILGSDGLSILRDNHVVMSWQRK